MKLVDRQVLRQSMNMVLDVSINEYTVNQIGNSRLPLNIFYPKLENEIMKNTRPFLKELLKT